MQQSLPEIADEEEEVAQEVVEEEVLVVAEEAEVDLVVEEVVVLVDTEVAMVVVVDMEVVTTRVAVVVVVMVSRVVAMDNLVEDMDNKGVVMEPQVEDMEVNQVEVMVVNLAQVMVDNRIVEANQTVDMVDNKEVPMEEVNRAVDIASNMVAKIVEATMHNLLVVMDLNHQLQDSILVVEAMAHHKLQQATTLPQLQVRDIVHQQQQLEDNLTGIKVTDNNLLHQHTAQVAMVHNKQQVSQPMVVKVMVARVVLIINQEVHQVHIPKMGVQIIRLTEVLLEPEVMPVVQEQGVLMEVLEKFRLLKKRLRLIRFVCFKPFLVMTDI